jgi:hypothetical protein
MSQAKMAYRSANVFLVNLHGLNNLAISHTNTHEYNDLIPQPFSQPLPAHHGAVSGAGWIGKSGLELHWRTGPCHGPNPNFDMEERDRNLYEQGLYCTYSTCRHPG